MLPSRSWPSERGDSLDRRTSSLALKPFRLLGLLLRLGFLFFLLTATSSSGLRFLAAFLVGTTLSLARLSSVQSKRRQQPGRLLGPGPANARA